MMRRVTNLPWIINSVKSGEDKDTVGGVVILAKAAVSLLGGDAVFVSDDLTVSKSVTAGDYSRRCGIVVSGNKVWSGSGLYIPDDSSLVGVSVADPDKDVLVCIQGLCYGIAGAALTAGNSLVASTTTAGRLVTGASLTIAAGAVAVTSTAANGAIISGHGQNQIFGVAWKSATLGSPVLVLVSPS